MSVNPAPLFALPAYERGLPGCEDAPSQTAGLLFHVQMVLFEGEGSAPLPGEVFCPVQMAEDACPRRELGQTCAAREGSGGSSSPWQLWQPGICSPTELGVQQSNP